METKLRENDAKKPGWVGLGIRHLLDRAHGELVEMEQAVDEEATPEEVYREAADICNMVMMAAENYAGSERGRYRGKEDDHDQQDDSL